VDLGELVTTEDELRERPSTRPDEVPSAARMLRDQLDVPDLTADAVDARLAESYQQTLN
jgi:hypothetical protein